MNIDSNNRFIEKAYNNIMRLGEELMALRTKSVTDEDKEKIEKEIIEKEYLFQSLEKDFNKIMKSHASMKRLDKLNDKKKQAEIIPMPQSSSDTKSNLGAIVQQVPNINDKIK